MFYAYKDLNNNIVVQFGETTYIVETTDTRYLEVIRLCQEYEKTGDYYLIETLQNLLESIIDNNNEIVIGDSTISMKGEDFYLDDEIIPKNIARYIISATEQESSIEKVNQIVQFMKNVGQMPTYFKDASGVAREDIYRDDRQKRLYTFVTRFGYPITSEGCFLALKNVSYNYKDIYTGTIDNRPGMKVSMDRFMVNHNPNETCSHGLHVRNDGYSFTGEKIMIVKVNPKNVCSLPNDYKDAKMRVCEYEVIRELKENEKLTDVRFTNQFDDIPTGNIYSSVNDPHHLYKSFIDSEGKEYIVDQNGKKSTNLESFEKFQVENAFKENTWDEFWSINKTAVESIRNKLLRKKISKNKAHYEIIALGDTQKKNPYDDVVIDPVNDSVNDMIEKINSVIP